MHRDLYLKLLLNKPCIMAWLMNQRMKEGMNEEMWRPKIHV